MGELSFGELFLGLIIIAIIYMIYPFIRIKIMKTEYDKKSFEKMIKWNSIIICLIDFIIASVNEENALWSALPGFIYYYINKLLWMPKEKVFVCSNCKEEISEYDTECPHCGASFKEELEEKNIEQKYSDLIKLKELLDKNIISKKEFEQEKKKILK